MESYLTSLASNLVLGALLAELQGRHGKWSLVDHWKQGEFHHDVVVRIDGKDAPAPILVIATNCNGGVKEVLAFAEVPERFALWHSRCPNESDFTGDLSPVLAATRTEHWFDPCNLLGEDARSELRPEHRRRQFGGGWEPVF